MSKLPSGWKEENNALQKEFIFSDFTAAMAFVNKVATLAEQANHHPDIHIYYKRVALELTTHDAGGVTEKDYSLATKIDQIR